MSPRILHLTAGALSRGAARGALWLHQGLLQLGIESRLLTTDVESSLLGVLPIRPSGLGQMQLWSLRQLDRLPLRFHATQPHATLSPGWVGLDLRKMPGYDWADIIHLHWVNDGLLDFRCLPRIEKPIIWTVRDLWPLTGLCHYPQACDRWLQACGQCPQLGSQRHRDLSRWGFHHKRHLWSQANLTFVAISDWVLEQLQRSPVTAGIPSQRIWNCIDESVFYPEPQFEARRLLGLEPSGTYLLAGAQNLDEPWKGAQVLVELMPWIRQQGWHLLLFGRSSQELEARLGTSVQSFGPVHDDAKLRYLYNAADTFIMPSLQEAFGKTAAEALACGTPVVAFSGTGIAGFLEKRLGYIADWGNLQDLRWQTIESIKSNIYSKHDRATTARNSFGRLIAAKQYLDCYLRIH